MPKKLHTPPPDQAQGAIMSRKTQLGLSLKDIADGTGLNYGRLRRFWNYPPIMWNYDDLMRVLAFLGLTAVLVVKEEES